MSAQQLTKYWLSPLAPKTRCFQRTSPTTLWFRTSQLWDTREDDRTLRDYGELEPYRVPAAQLYHGLQHTELMRGVELLRRTFGQTLDIDVKIISAGFGVVDEDQLLPPYEATFAGQPQASITAVSRRLLIPQADQCADERCV